MASNRSVTVERPTQALTVVEVKTELEAIRLQVEEALPKQMDADRFLRVVAGAITKNPDILKCDRLTIFRAVIEAAQLGLEPTGLLGSAYLVPYGKTCTLIPGYRGLIDLARRSGEIESIYAQIVHARDVFRIRQGTDPGIDHEPYIAPPLMDPKDAEQMAEQDPGPVIGAYMVAVLRDRQGAASLRQIEYMTFAEIEAVRRRSRAGSSGPWVSDWSEMARKTVVRRGAKYLPLTPEAVRAFSLDEEAERDAVISPKRDSGRARLLAGLAARGTAQEADEGDSGVVVESDGSEGAVGHPEAAGGICGADPGENALGLTLPCAEASGHDSVHRSSEGTWPR